MKRSENKKYTTTRTVYKSVKKYDHAQFDDFCTRVYTEGFRDGAAAVPGIDVEDLTAKIATVKGIGEAKMTKIKEAIEDMFTAQTKKEDNAG